MLGRRRRDQQTTTRRASRVDLDARVYCLRLALGGRRFRARAVCGRNPLTTRAPRTPVCQPGAARVESRTGSAPVPRTPQPGEERPHRPCREIDPYASANATCDSIAASIARAAPAANDTPWSVASENATGPNIIGSATSHPPTWWPKRRPARLALADQHGRDHCLHRDVLCRHD